MRARGIKPGFFKNEILAELTPHARLLFVGLWCCADRAGRMEDRPKRIRAEVFPYETVDVDELLEELACAGFITRYDADGTAYLEVLNFAQHQSPHVKEAESTIPAPDKHQTRTRLAPPDSLTPSSLTPDSLTEDKTLVHRTPKTTAPPNGFDEWWAMYPRKKGKGQAIKAYRLALKKTTVEVLRTGLEAQLPEMMANEPTYVPHPTTWLNGERWGDVLDTIPDPHLLRIQRLRELRERMGDGAVEAMCETDELWQEVCGA